MSPANETKIAEIKINANNLFREESFTDLSFATIRRLTPIKTDGSEDETRQTLFVGMTQLMTPGGAIPVQGIIEGAKNLAEAAEKLPAAIEKTVEQMIAEAKELQRQEASKIVVPGR
jgi:hypothetical protein